MTTRAPLTIVIPARNEAGQIGECVGALAWAHEVIVVDGGSTDETPRLAAAIAATVGAPRHGAFAVRRRNHFLGRPVGHASWGSDWVVRLFRRNRRFTERKLHEALEPVPDVGRLATPLDHVPYRDLSHFLQKLDLYSDLAAEQLVARGRRPRVRDVLLRPPARFVRMYLLQLGVLDGWRGAMLCGLAAASVLLKYARLWERSR